MKLLPLFLIGISVFGFAACEKEPPSKIESIIATEQNGVQTSGTEAAHVH